jgi:hypothetical protein
MGVTLIYCGYQACLAGTFECSLQDFPDVSHVMGHPPLNKLYAIMLTVHALVKSAYVRAYHHRLSAFPNVAKKNTYCLYYAALSIIFGPCIGYFDVFYNVKIHCTVTAFFTIGELSYIFSVISMIKNNRLSFASGQTQTYIDYLLTCRAILFIEGCLSMYLKINDLHYGALSAFIEWTVFEMTFVVFAILSWVMPYQLKVVP